MPRLAGQCLGTALVGPALDGAQGMLDQRGKFSLARFAALRTRNEILRRAQDRPVIGPRRVDPHNRRCRLERSGNGVPGPAAKAVRAAVPHRYQQVRLLDHHAPRERHLLARTFVVDVKAKLS